MFELTERNAQRIYVCDVTNKDSQISQIGNAYWK